MIAEELLHLLACPESGQPLLSAGDELLRTLNSAIKGGTVQNRGGRSITEPLEAGLVRNDQSLVYPVVEGIPVLLVEEGIPVVP